MADMTQGSTPFDAEKRIAQYVALRDALRDFDETHNRRRKQYVDTLAALTAQIEAFMDTNNVQNLKTKGGTAHFTTKRTASLADADAFMKFVIATQQFDLLDRRANATAVAAFVEANNALPPGCNLNTLRSLGVRRPGDKT